MDLVLDRLGKLYSETWIFKNLSQHIPAGTHLGVRGRNGAGKSTLLQLILGLQLPSKGNIEYRKGQQLIPRDDWGMSYSFSGPYMSVPLEFRADELINHAVKFRPLLSNLKVDDVIRLAMLEDDRNKYLSQYSTGMLQRFKVALTLCTESDLVILDEPTSNLDEEGKRWFNKLVSQTIGSRTLIIASNEESDFQHCQEFVSLNS